MNMQEKITAFENLLITMRDNPQTDDADAQWLHRLLGNVRKVHAIARQRQFSKPLKSGPLTPDMLSDLDECVATINKAMGCRNFSRSSGGLLIQWEPK